MNLAERAGIILSALGNGSVIKFDFDVNTLHDEIERLVLRAAGSGKNFLEIFLPAHPNDEPRDNEIAYPSLAFEEAEKIKAYFKIAETKKTENVRECIDQWRHQLKGYGLSEGFSVVISPTRLCPQCEGMVEKRMHCKLCGGRMPKSPTLKDVGYSKFHTVTLKFVKKEIPEEQRQTQAAAEEPPAKPLLMAVK